MQAGEEGLSLVSRLIWANSRGSCGRKQRALTLLCRLSYNGRGQSPSGPFRTGTVLVVRRTKVSVKTRFLSTILVTVACWLCAELSPAQLPIAQPLQITSFGLIAGQTNCIVVSSANPGAAAVVVELNGIPIRKTITPLNDLQSEICFHLPAGASGGDITVTATCGGFSTYSCWTVP